MPRTYGEAADGDRGDARDFAAAPDVDTVNIGMTRPRDHVGQAFFPANNVLKIFVEGKAYRVGADTVVANVPNYAERQLRHGGFTVVSDPNAIVLQHSSSVGNQGVLDASAWIKSTGEFRELKADCWMTLARAASDIVKHQRRRCCDKEAKSERE